MRKIESEAAPKSSPILGAKIQVMLSLSWALTWFSEVPGPVAAPGSFSWICVDRDGHLMVMMEIFLDDEIADASLLQWKSFLSICNQFLFAWIERNSDMNRYNHILNLQSGENSKISNQITKETFLSPLLANSSTTSSKLSSSFLAKLTDNSNR